MTVKRWALEAEDARTIAEDTEKAARENGVALVIVVVDAAGVFLRIVRMDGTKATSVPIAIGKARTAAMFQLPSADYGSRVLPGGPSFGIENVFQGEMLSLPGGMPILVDGECVGALSVSGALPEVDEAIASGVVARFVESQSRARSTRDAG
jgi:uncharacterized protein GlcG (DUF336 family)